MPITADDRAAAGAADATSPTRQPALSLTDAEVLRRRVRGQTLTTLTGLAGVPVAGAGMLLPLLAGWPGWLAWAGPVALVTGVVAADLSTTVRHPRVPAALVDQHTRARRLQGLARQAAARAQRPDLLHAVDSLLADVAELERSATAGRRPGGRAALAAVHAQVRTRVDALEELAGSLAQLAAAAEELAESGLDVADITPASVTLARESAAEAALTAASYREAVAATQALPAATP